MSTPETILTEDLLASQNGDVFDILLTAASLIGAITAGQTPVVEQKDLCIRI